MDHRYFYFRFSSAPHFSAWDIYFSLPNIFAGMDIEKIQAMFKPVERNWHYFYFHWIDIKRVYQILIKNGLEDGHVRDISARFNQEYTLFYFFI